MVFSKLDLRRAYKQLALDEKSQEYTTVNTHKGLLRYRRLSFGISSAPGIFQRTIEGLLQNIPGVVVYIDDILITCRTQNEVVENLQEVLKRLQEAGLSLKREKCQFLQESVVHIASIGRGYIPQMRRFEPITVHLYRREHQIELKAYLGMLTYYSKFLQTGLVYWHLCMRFFRKESRGLGQRHKTGHSKSQRS